MSKRCTEGGSVHPGPFSQESHEIVVGNEIITYTATKCTACGIVTSNVITGRRPK